MTVIATWDGLSIDDAALAEYGWYNNRVTVNSISYRVFYGHMVAHLREADARIAAFGGLGPSVSLVFDTDATTDVDPGSGGVHLSSATQNTASVIYVSTTNASGTDVAATIDAWDDSTNPSKGFVRIADVRDSTKFLDFELSSIASGSGYRKLTVNIVTSSAASPLSDGTPVILSFSRTGDKGETGATGGFAGGTLTGTLNTDGNLITGKIIDPVDIVRAATGIEPVLDLNLTTIDGFFGTFSRASEAEYYDANGVLQTAQVDELRIDHDPTTGECVGYLGEDSAPNLLTHSDDLSDASWLKSGGAVSANVIAGPKATVTADLFAEDGANSTHFIYKNVTVAADTTHSASIFIKAAGRTNVVVRYGEAGGGFKRSGVTVNLTTGVSSSSDSNGPAESAFKTKLLPNGWVRVTVTGKPDAVATSMLFQILLSDGASTTYTGDGVSGVYLWRGQVEPGESSTSPIGTGASTVTRAADIGSQTGTDFSEWINPDEFTVHVEFMMNSVTPGSRIIGMSDGTLNNVVVLTRGIAVPLGTRWDILSGSLSQGQVGIGNILEDTNYRAAISMAENNFISSINGAAATIDSVGLMPIGLNQLLLGHTSGGLSGAAQDGTIKRVIVWPRALSSTLVEDITK